MKAIGSVLEAPLKLLGLVPKTPKPPAPNRPVTTDDAMDAANNAQAQYGRIGGGADQTNGINGSQAGQDTSKTILG